MNERQAAADAREDWEAAERDLDQNDRDPDYGRLWASVEAGRQGYQRAVAERRDESEAEN